MAGGEDVFAAVRHAAGGALASRLRTGVLAEASPMGIGVRRFGAYALAPIGGGGGKLWLEHRGVLTFRETSVGAGFAMALFPRLQVGLQAGLVRSAIAGYGGRASLPLAVGLAVEVVEGFRVTVQFGMTAWRSGGRVGPTPFAPQLRCALGRRFSEQVGLAVELVRRQGMPLSVEPVIDYAPVPGCRFRAGLGSADRSMFLSTGWRLKGVWVDMAVQHHPLAGWTTGVGLRPVPMED